MRIETNAKVKPKAGSTLPLLQVTPEVAGKVRQVDPWTLVFEAKKPFDPDQTYTVTLGELEDEHGKPVFAGWSATFSADPQIEIAGKIISYIPVKGDPRVITVRPYGNTRVGPDRSAKVIGGRQPADAAADDHQVVVLTGVGG